MNDEEHKRQVSAIYYFLHGFAVVACALMLPVCVGIFAAIIRTHLGAP